MGKMEIYENESFSGNRCLADKKDVTIRNCTFDGSSGGENALLRSSRLVVENVLIDQKGVFWNSSKLKITTAEFAKRAEMALWYSDHLNVSDASINCDKVLRECSHIDLNKCGIVSNEFGWFNSFINVMNTKVEGDYFMLKSENMAFRNTSATGSSAYQYVKNATFENCEIIGDNMFWHAENVLIKDCEIKGDSIGWFSDRILMINCRISGRNPFCNCKNLQMSGCTIVGTGIAFENSEVEADLEGSLESIVNPAAGVIKVPEVKEVVMDKKNPRCRIQTLTENY